MLKLYDNLGRVYKLFFLGLLVDDIVSGLNNIILVFCNFGKVIKIVDK